MLAKFLSRRSSHRADVAKLHVTGVLPGDVAVYRAAGIHDPHLMCRLRTVQVPRAEVLALADDPVSAERARGILADDTLTDFEVQVAVTAVFESIAR